MTPHREGRNPDALQRLHPLTLLFRLLAMARKLLLPGLLVLFVARKSRWELWAMVFIIPATIYEVIRYLSLRYRFATDEIIVREGILFRNERHIPFDRIQNIDLVQGPLHRAFGVADVVLETASGSEPEATFRVLSLAAIEEMRGRVFASRADPPPAPSRQEPALPREEIEEHGEPREEGASPTESPSRKVLLHLRPGDLIRLAVIETRGLGLIPPVLYVLWEYDLLDRMFDNPNYEQFWNHLLTVGIPLVLGILVLVALPILFVLSVAWALFRFHDFRITRAGEDLRISCGLWTRRTATVPLGRIQFVSLRETLRHRWLGCVSIRIETAGSGEKEDEAIGRRWFVPLVRREAAAGLLNELRPELGARLRGLDWRPPAPGTTRRLTRKALLLGFPIVGAAAVLAALGWWVGLGLLLLPPLLVLYARNFARWLAHARAGDSVFFRSGVVTRTVSATFFDRIQVLTLLESPFDRRHSTASLRVDTAGAGPAGHTVNIPYLEGDTARELLRAWTVETERRGFRW